MHGEIVRMRRVMCNNLVVVQKSRQFGEQVPNLICDLEGSSLSAFQCNKLGPLSNK
jgi:hypothetical protein